VRNRWLTAVPDWPTLGETPSFDRKREIESLNPRRDSIPSSTARTSVRWFLFGSLRFPSLLSVADLVSPGLQPCHAIRVHGGDVTFVASHRKAALKSCAIGPMCRTPGCVLYRYISGDGSLLSLSRDIAGETGEKPSLRVPTLVMLQAVIVTSPATSNAEVGLEFQSPPSLRRDSAGGHRRALPLA